MFFTKSTIIERSKLGSYIFLSVFLMILGAGCGVSFIMFMDDRILGQNTEIFAVLILFFGLVLIAAGLTTLGLIPGLRRYMQESGRSAVTYREYQEWKTGYKNPQLSAQTAPQPQLLTRTVFCTSCGQKLTVPAEGSLEGTCPRCGGRFIVQ